MAGANVGDGEFAVLRAIGPELVIVAIVRPGDVVAVAGAELESAAVAGIIGVGEADGGIQVVSYDSDADRAVVRIDGVQQTLELRKAASPANAVAFNSFVPAPAYITGPAPRPLSAEAARKQREARRGRPGGQP